MSKFPTLFSVRVFFQLLLVGAFSNACQKQTTFNGNSRYTNPVEESGDSMTLIEQDYDAADIDVATIKVNKKAGVIEHAFSFSALPPSKQMFKQDNRQPHKDTFKQGKDGSAAEDSFPVREAGPLDLLVVMDNSGTMKPYQDLLSTNMASLLKHVANTNWQIAVVTTDNSCPRDVISAEDYANDPVGAETRFKQAVAVGTGGNPLERGIEMAVRGLNGECAGQDRAWLRAGSTTAVLMITDEENCGSAINEGCAVNNYPYMGPDEFVAAAPAATKVYGILYDRKTCEDDGYEKDPADYYNLVSQTKGIWGAICQADYTATLTAVSADVSKIVKREFKLANTPDAGTLEVKIDSKTLNANEYTLSGDMVTLVEAIDMNDQMLIAKYYYNAVPRRSSYTLGNAAAADSLVVKVNNVIMPPGDYQFDSGTRQLMFGTMPEDSADIEVNYRAEGTLKKDFTLTDDAMARSVKVKVNGKTFSGFTYNTTTHKLTLAVAPSDASDIEVEYNVASDLVTTYPVIDVADQDIEFVDLIDSDSGERIPFQFNGQELTVPAEEVVDGRKVVADFVTTAVMPSAIDIVDLPIENTVKFTVEGDQTCLEEFYIEGTMAHLACASPLVEEIGITYNYVSMFRTSFSIKGLVTEDALWQVWIDGVEFTDFILEDQTVSIDPANLTINSKVKIRVSPR